MSFKLILLVCVFSVTYSSVNSFGWSKQKSFSFNYNPAPVHTKQVTYSYAPPPPIDFFKIFDTTLSAIIRAKQAKLNTFVEQQARLAESFRKHQQTIAATQKPYTFTFTKNIVPHVFDVRVQGNVNYGGSVSTSVGGTSTSTTTVTQPKPTQSLLPTYEADAEDEEDEEVENTITNTNTNTVSKPATSDFVSINSIQDSNTGADSNDEDEEEQEVVAVAPVATQAPAQVATGYLPPYLPSESRRSYAASNRNSVIVSRSVEPHAPIYVRNGVYYN